MNQNSENPNTLGRIAARLCLFFAVLFTLMGSAMACYCPGMFLMATGLSIVSICCGRKVVRIVALVMFGTSLVLASQTDLAEQRMYERALASRIKVERQNRNEEAKLRSEKIDGENIR